MPVILPECVELNTKDAISFDVLPLDRVLGESTLRVCIT